MARNLLFSAQNQILLKGNNGKEIVTIFLIIGIQKHLLPLNNRVMIQYMGSKTKESRTQNISNCRPFSLATHLNTIKTLCTLLILCLIPILIWQGLLTPSQNRFQNGSNTYELMFFVRPYLTYLFHAWQLLLRWNLTCWFLLRQSLWKILNNYGRSLRKSNDDWWPWCKMEITQSSQNLQKKHSLIYLWHFQVWMIFEKKCTNC